MVLRCISAYENHSVHTWKGTIGAEKFMQVLEQYVLQYRREGLAYFSKATLNCICYNSTTSP